MQITDAHRILLRGKIPIPYQCKTDEWLMINRPESSAEDMWLLIKTIVTVNYSVCFDEKENQFSYIIKLLRNFSITSQSSFWKRSQFRSGDYVESGRYVNAVDVKSFSSPSASEFAVYELSCE